MLHVCAKWPCRGGGDAGHVQHLLFGETQEQGAWVNSCTMLPFYESIQKRVSNLFVVEKL